MSTLRINLFPEYQKDLQKIYNPKFIKTIETHVKDLGYKSKIIGDELVIVGPDGGLSSSPGTLIGWRFVNEIEKFLIANGFDWMHDSHNDREKTSVIFGIVSELAKTISEKICEHGNISSE
jgi:hypothetical protein